MKLRPFFRKAARLEYEEAALWYDAQKAGLGVEFVEEIDKALLTACEAPQRCPAIVQDVRRVRVKRFPYFVFFRVRENSLIVLSVFHVRRSPTVWRERT